MNSRLLMFLTLGCLLCFSAAVGAAAGGGAAASALGRCSICAEEMTRVGATWLPCGHAFHTHCLKNWLLGTDITPPHDTCPMCRKKVTAEFARLLFPPEEAGHAAPVAPAAAPAVPAAPHAQTFEEGVAALRAMPEPPVGVRPDVWQAAVGRLDLGRFFSLTGLDLETPELVAIINALPPIVRHGIRVLHIEQNNLRVLPPEIGQFIALRELYAHYNHLTVVPAEIGQLRDLQTLVLSENKLTSLRAEIGQLHNLQRLVLRRNHLTVLPYEIRQLANLRELVVDRGVTVPPLGAGVQVIRS